MACGCSVSSQDAARVLGRLESMARASTHGGYNSRMTSDPFLVSKAVFEWWWLDKDHRGEFYRRIKAGRASTDAFNIVGSSSEDARSAAAVLQVEVGSLDMGHIGFEELVAHRRRGVKDLNLLRRVGETVRRACLESPLGQAVAACAMTR